MSPKENEQGPGSPLPPITLLLAEDSPDDVFFFTRILKKSGLSCELKHALDGGEAIQALKEASDAGNRSLLPDLIFLDLKMPVLNGFDVLSWMKEQEFIPPIPIFVLSGSDDDGDMRKARDLGALDYLVKPITLETLLRCIKIAGDRGGPTARKET